MRIAITGDSFTSTYRETYLQQICNDVNLQVISCQGFSGQSEYRIYRNFHEILKLDTDVILCCHTHHSRLYHPYEPVTSSYHGIKNEDVVEASQKYFEHLYDDNFAREIQNLLIKDMQNICKQKNIKLINIPCFDHSHIDKFYGLWILSGQGLMECSKVDYKRDNNKEWENQHYDYRPNHFTKNGHNVLANNIIPHIKSYLNNNMDFHVTLLFPELFA
jgi:hypothetical protein